MTEPVDPVIDRKYNQEEEDTFRGALAKMYGRKPEEIFISTRGNEKIYSISEKIITHNGDGTTTEEYEERIVFTDKLSSFT